MIFLDRMKKVALYHKQVALFKSKSLFCFALFCFKEGLTILDTFKRTFQILKNGCFRNRRFDYI